VNENSKKIFFTKQINKRPVNQPDNAKNESPVIDYEWYLD